VKARLLPHATEIFVTSKVIQEQQNNKKSLVNTTNKQTEVTAECLSPKGHRDRDEL
jgi:hypothetical protein